MRISTRLSIGPHASLLPVALAAAGCTAPALSLIQAAGTSTLVLQSPTPSAGAGFGASVCFLDFNGNGIEDIAIGAPGENAVYIFFGPGFQTRRRFASPIAGSTRFGTALAAGPLDGAPGDELVIGASSESVAEAPNSGRVWVLSRSRPTPVPLPIQPRAGALLGWSLAVADFDGDGTMDVAAGAPKLSVDGAQAGAVIVYSIAKDEEWVLRNPLGAWNNGNYGHDLSAADADGDGSSDLFVSAVGNRTIGGIAGAGQVWVHVGPVPPETSIAVEDPDPDPLDGARFGMSIYARNEGGGAPAELLVGAPRKDAGGAQDSGQGFLYFGPEFEAATARELLHPEPQSNDLLGFRVLIADVVGDATPDPIVASLASDVRKGLLIWDGADLDAPPLFVPAPTGSGAHFVQGFAHGRRGAGGREPLLLGDPDFNPGSSPRAGRAVLLSFAP